MRRLQTPGWLAVHVLTVGLVAGMLWLGWWQLSRATGGNALSWGYAFQWPVFAAFTIFVWAREARREVRAASTPAPASAAPAPLAGRPVVTRRAPAPPPVDPADDPELAAYQRYLTWMREHPGARAVDYPG